MAILGLAVAVSLAGSAALAVPVAKLEAKVSPHGRLSSGTPIRFAFDTRFASKPPGRSLVLQRLDYLFPRSIAVNGRLFPSCSVRELERAHNRLRACRRGSRIGRGTVTGDVVHLGVTSRARLTLFNGPDGRSITMNVSIKSPALVDKTVSARLRRVEGADKLTLVAPAELTNILDGPIVTSHIHLAIGATRIVHGIKRGYVEAKRCPHSGKAQMHGTFRFRRGAKASADAKVAC